MICCWRYLVSSALSLIRALTYSNFGILHGSCQSLFLCLLRAFSIKRSSALLHQTLNFGCVLLILIEVRSLKEWDDTSVKAKFVHSRSIYLLSSFHCLGIFPHREQNQALANARLDELRVDGDGLISVLKSFRQCDEFGVGVGSVVVPSWIVRCAVNRFGVGSDSSGIVSGLGGSRQNVGSGFQMAKHVP